MLYARTLTSAAHALAVGAVRPSSICKRLLQRGKPEVLFDRAVKLYQDVIGFDTACDVSYDVLCNDLKSLAMQSDRSIALEKAKLAASFGECWFCIASAID